MMQPYLESNTPILAFHTLSSQPGHLFSVDFSVVDEVGNGLKLCQLGFLLAHPPHQTALEAPVRMLRTLQDVI